ncbi:MAG: bifunctional 2-methylcitrate synthase/citrate synthase [Flavobacteriales bacterium]|nr:bifunctional 2-methylcitrate synthase/citrate synthase [Flavobacteriales bacterium]
MEETEIKRGLMGVTVDTTEISKVMPDINRLTYRGYTVNDLCNNCNFEETALLLLKGEIPSTGQLKEFEKREVDNRVISDQLISIIKHFPQTAHPMDGLRTAISFLGQEDSRIWDNSEETNFNKFELLYAKIPTIIAAIQRCKEGKPIIEPNSELNRTANFFNMCFGLVPEPDILRGFNVSQILYAEHSFNASTFTARVIASTTSDMYSSVAGAIGALKGPLHGGANEQVMHDMIEIGEAENANEWMDEAFEEKRKIMGFGHRVYKKGDSRVPEMKKWEEKIALLTDGKKWIDIANLLEEKMISEKGIYPNLDFPAGPTYYMMGFDIELFTPIFVMSRITGWAAHILEQVKNNKLIRPLSHYKGVEIRRIKDL